jgi:uncharacterized protein YkwD
MERIALRPLAFAVVASCLVGIAAASAPAAPADHPHTILAARDGLESPVVSLINQVRRCHGLPGLRASVQLGRAAVAHASAMGRGGFFSHASADGASAGARIRRHYDVSRSSRWRVGETLLWRSPDVTPQESVRMWLDSPAHRHVLLHPAFREIGVAGEIGVAAVHVFQAPGQFGHRDVMLVVADFGVR